MNNKTSANSAQVSEFRLTITKGDQCPGRPELLGRDIRYVLNVKAVGEDGRVIEGVRYTVNCETGVNSRISFTGRGEEQVSTAAGEDFSIYGGLPTMPGMFEFMNKSFEVVVIVGVHAITRVSYRMGRLCYWVTPDAYFSSDGRFWISTHTEWVGEGTNGLWHWSRNVEVANLIIPDKGINTSYPTHPYLGEDSVNVDFRFDNVDFTEGERFRVSMPSSSSWGDWTATLPFERVIEVRSK